MLTIVLPLLARSLNISITLVAVKLSSPVVGSSKNIIFGFVISYIPIDVRFLYPPDTPLMKLLPILTSAHLVNPNSDISSSTRYNFWNYVKLSLKFAAKWKHYRGVNIASNESSCITYPIWFEYGSTDCISDPLILYDPYNFKLLDINLPAKKFRKVVLPDPEGPKMAVNDSAGIHPFCGCKIVLYYDLTFALISIS